MSKIDKYIDFVKNMKNLESDCEKAKLKYDEMHKQYIDKIAELNKKGFKMKDYYSDILERIYSLKKYLKPNKKYNDYEITFPIDIKYEGKNYINCTISFERKDSDYFSGCYLGTSNKTIDNDLFNYISEKEIRWNEDEILFIKFYKALMSPDVEKYLEAKRMGLL